MEFKTVNQQAASTDVKAWIQNVRSKIGTYNKTLNGKTYILHSLGEKPTGGYAVAVVSVLDTSNQIIVNIEEKHPKPGDFVTQAFTNPYTVIEIPATNKPIVPKVTKK